MPMSLKNMRGCASPASTATCRSVSGTRRLRYSTHIKCPCISDLPINPRSFYSAYLSRSKISGHYRRLLPPTTPSLPPQPSRPDLDRSGSTDDSIIRSGSSDRVIVKSSLPPTPSSRQVVVLRVSLHCRGCEGKLRKHLSKMQGVMSFSIDLEAKKVTVIGDITPAGVLTSIAKVKNAQFWPSTLPS